VGVRKPTENVSHQETITSRECGTDYRNKRGRNTKSGKKKKN
jgi:hypothetical protein